MTHFSNCDSSRLSRDSSSANEAFSELTAASAESRLLSSSWTILSFVYLTSTSLAVLAESSSSCARCTENFWLARSSALMYPLRNIRSECSSVFCAERRFSVAMVMLLSTVNNSVTKVPSRYSCTAIVAAAKSFSAWIIDARAFS